MDRYATHIYHPAYLRQMGEISDVRLDIAIPKGYDKSVLKDVEQYAKDKGVPTTVFETQ